jgi:hypothetical protein
LQKSSDGDVSQLEKFASSAMREFKAVALLQQSAHGRSSPEKETAMSTAEDYLAKADEALAQLKEAKSESERSRLRRAHSVYLRLSTHGEEAAVRAAMKPAPKIKSEKEKAAAAEALRRYGSANLR